MPTPTAKPRAAKRRADLYPELPDINGIAKPPHFWLAAYFQKLAQFAALKKELGKVYIRRGPLTPLFFALSEAKWNKQRDLDETLKFVVHENCLLFAHAETTVFDGVPA